MDATERTLHLHSFSGDAEQRSMECCRFVRSVTLSNSAIAFVDHTGPGVGALAAQNTGPIVLLSSSGMVTARAPVDINALVLTVDPNRRKFAFIGNTLSNPKVAVYFGSFDEPMVRPVMDFSYSRDPNVQRRWSVDWSPDGKNVLVSLNDHLYSVDLVDAVPHEVTEGSLGRWSPNGLLISYVDRLGKPVVLDLATGEKHPIPGNHQVRSPMDWSPSGEYLLLPDTGGCFSTEGCLWVYRLRDNAFFPVLDVPLALQPRWFTIIPE